MGSKRVPEIRFKGFSGEWEERKVKNISNKTFGGGTPKTKILEYWNGDIPWIQSSDLIEHKVSNVDPKKKITEIGLQNSAAKLIPMNSIAIVTRVGVGKIGLIQYEYTTSQDFLSLSQLKINEWFGVYSLYNSLQKELHKVQGTSIKGITKNELLDKTIILPSFIEEQSQIGNFFKQLDETITIQQQEIDTLKQMKQGFLQKMFPKEGESIPEIRFSGFSGEWEETKLSEMVEIFGGGTPSTNVPEYWDGDINWYSPAEIGNEIYVSDSKRNITELGLKKSSAKILPANKTILFTSRAGIGNMAILKKDGATNQGFQSLVVNDENDVYFLYSLGKKIKEYALKNASGSTFLEISGKKLCKMELLIPQLNERIKLGNFFKQLDETIVLHEKELDILQKTKKAFLQKMFV